MGVLYEANLLRFIFLVCLLGGGAAWMAGRAIASGWSSPRPLIFYMLLLGAAVRFLHYGMFGETLLSLHYYLVHTAVLIALSLIGFQMTRAGQMTRQYFWLYERTGPFTWRPRPDASA